MTAPRYFRIAAVKSTGLEQVTVDMPSWNPVTGEPVAIDQDTMKDSINYMLNVLDDRADAAHMRTLAVYGLLQYIPDQYRSMVVEIVDVLTGKADPGLVVQRWKAAAEETAELEAARWAAQQRQHTYPMGQEGTCNNRVGEICTNPDHYADTDLPCRSKEA